MSFPVGRYRTDHRRGGRQPAATLLLAGRITGEFETAPLLFIGNLCQENRPHDTLFR
ncbi:hypothetical protein [Sporomusa termitida]|uniref:hypothetical protein n=1 Tax=Sporomusa termitida TaxID=2377 RepID=UPI00147849A7|nr:hypothetical protein [Sporomusa termitida]